MKARVNSKTSSDSGRRQPYIVFSCIFSTFKVISFKADISAESLMRKLIKLGMKAIKDVKADSNNTDVESISKLYSNKWYYDSRNFSFLGLSYEWANEYESNGVKMVRAKILFKYKFYNCQRSNPLLSAKTVSNFDSRFANIVSNSSSGADTLLTRDTLSALYCNSAIVYNSLLKSMDEDAISKFNTCISEALGVLPDLIEHSYVFKILARPTEKDWAWVVPSTKV